MGELQESGHPWNFESEAGTHQSQESLCLSFVPDSEKKVSGCLQVGSTFSGFSAWQEHGCQHLQWTSNLNQL